MGAMWKIVFIGIIVFSLGYICFGPKGATTDMAATGTPTATLADVKRAVLDYRACEGGMTVERATTTSLRAARAQEIGAATYVGEDGRDNTKIAIEYKAANGARKAVTFGYHKSTGKVGAEDDDALDILRMIEAGCR